MTIIDNAELNSDYGENAYGTPMLERGTRPLAHGEQPATQPWSHALMVRDGYRRCACPHHPALLLMGRAAGCPTYIYPIEGDAPTRCDQCRYDCGGDA